MPKPAADSDFRDTRPLVEHQERLHAQWGRPRAHYKPNHVPARQRVLHAIVSLTWVGWALIGLLTGHVFLFIAAPIHFTGIPALVFALAVLVSAAACAVTFVDHYDRRDNEAIYQKVHRRLWWTAAGCFVLAATVGVAEIAGLLPYSHGKAGLLSTEQIQGLFEIGWLQRLLSTHHKQISTWCTVTTLWCICGFALSRRLGLLDDLLGQPRLGPWLIVIASMILPALVTFDLMFLDNLLTARLADWDMDEEDFRSYMSWMQTLLLTFLSVTAAFLAFLVAIFLHELGVITLTFPPDPREKALKFAQRRWR